MPRVKETLSTRDSLVRFVRNTAFNADLCFKKEQQQNKSQEGRMNSNEFQCRTLSISASTATCIFQTTVSAAPVSINTSQLDSQESGDKFAIGVTRSNTSRSYEGIGDQSATLPYLSAQAGGFYIEGLDIGYKITENPTLNWDLVAIPRFLGYEENDSQRLSGLNDTHYSYHGGISVN